MFKEALVPIKTALLLLLTLTILTGLLYPLAVTGLAQLLFPSKANGSLITQNNSIIGSSLIGQAFTNPAYFWGRPSATTPYPYNGAASSGSNLAPSNPELLKTVKERIQQFNEQGNLSIPVDLVTASASGLDPDISPYAAYFQSARVAKARNLSETQINALIAQQIQLRTLDLLGEPRINVLELNLALDNLGKPHE